MIAMLADWIVFALPLAGIALVIRDSRIHVPKWRRLVRQIKARGY